MLHNVLLALLIGWLFFVLLGVWGRLQGMEFRRSIGDASLDTPDALIRTFLWWLVPALVLGFLAWWTKPRRGGKEKQ